MGKPEGGSEDDSVLVRCPRLCLSEGELTGDQRVKPPRRRAGSVRTTLAMQLSLNLPFLMPQTHILLGASITPHC